MSPKGNTFKLVKTTDKFNPNIRQGTIPELTEEQYYELLEGEATVSETSAEYLISHGYAVGEE